MNPSVLSASVGDRVWLDADGDGSQDIGEPGIANVEVTLKDQWGTPVDVTITDVNGRYLFPGVTAGPGYYVEVTASTLPSGVTQSFPRDSPTTGRPPSPSSDGQNYTDADLGYRPTAGTATFGDLVWVDADNDGVRDPGEIGLGGVTVQLYRDANGNGVLDAGDTLVGTTTTAPDGSYLFTGVTASGTEDYIVNVADPGSAHRVHGHHPHVPQLPRCLQRRRLPERRLRLPGHRRDHLLHPGSRLAGHRRERALRRGETGIGGVTMELLERQPPGHRHDHDGRGRHVHVQRPRGRRRRLHDPDQRHGGRPRQLLRHDHLRPGAAARREQPGRQPGPQRPRPATASSPRAASATRSSTTSTATGPRTPARTGSPASSSVSIGTPMTTGPSTSASRWSGRSRRTPTGSTSSRGSRTTTTS